MKEDKKDFRDVTDCPPSCPRVFGTQCPYKGIKRNIFNKVKNNCEKI